MEIKLRIKAAIMARRRKERITYRYECNLTGETYTVTKKADNPDDLMSVAAWYDMNPESDDRPDDVKKRLGITSEE